jgi:hypothetical protein
MSVLEAAPVDMGHAAKPRGALKAADVVYEIKPARGGAARYVVIMHGKRQQAVDAARALADKGLAIGLKAHPSTSGASEDLLRALLKVTLASFKEIQGRHPDALTEDDLIREVGETLADKASGSPASLEEGWQQLLERGLRSKTALLKSSQFKSTAQASELLGVGDPAVRRRIRERKLFALRAPGDGDHRIPAWALDPEVTGAPTLALYESVPGMDEWKLYHFLSTPHGNLNGLRPFECLMSSANLPATPRSARDELLAALELATGASLLEVVLHELKAESKEGQSA